jgi:hypothetical protein
VERVMRGYEPGYPIIMEGGLLQQQPHPDDATWSFARALAPLQARCEALQRRLVPLARGQLDADPTNWRCAAPRPAGPTDLSGPALLMPAARTAVLRLARRGC